MASRVRCIVISARGYDLVCSRIVSPLRFTRRYGGGIWREVVNLLQQRPGLRVGFVARQIRLGIF